MSSQALLPGVQDVQKAYQGETHRLIPPAETIAQYREFMPAMGITRIANVTGLDRIGIPVSMACRPNSRSISVSQGKGLTLQAAKASALMESIEGYHAEHIMLPLKLASAREMRRAHCIAPLDRLPLIPGGLFHPDFRLLWIEGYDLIQQESVWVPYELVHTDFVLPQPAGSGCFVGGSNGLASGNHILEAISHALCELVERHSTTLWRLGGNAQHHATRVALDSIDDPGCLELLSKFERAAIDVAVWDVTSDVGIPAFACTIIDNEERAPHYLHANSGMGCHLTRHIALTRALSEAAQTRLTFISGARDDVTRRDYEIVRDRERLVAYRDWAAAQQPVARFEDAPDYDHETFSEDIGLILNRLQAEGFDRAIVVNLTKAEFRIPVVRVIVPDLEAGYDDTSYTPGIKARALLQKTV